jgi:hypothetical protein
MVTARMSLMQTVMPITGKLAAVSGLNASSLHQMQPVSEDDFQDLYKMQKAVWGKLGYTPRFAPRY